MTEAPEVTETALKPNFATPDKDPELLSVANQWS